MIWRPTRPTKLLLAAAILTLGCGESSAPPQAPPAPTGPSAPPAGGAPPMRIKRVSVVDREGIGSEAFSLLVPADWEAEAAVRWRLDNPAFPAYGTARVRNPRGTEGFEIFPNLPFFWSTDPMALSITPPGSKYFGNVVRQPVGAEQALREIVLPAFRAGAGESSRPWPAPSASTATGTTATFSWWRCSSSARSARSATSGRSAG